MKNIIKKSAILKKLREGFWKAYHQQQFCPKTLSLFFNPFHFARKGLFNNIKKISSEISGKVLDVGCGHKPYEHIFKFSEYIGLEIESQKDCGYKKADFFYDGNTFPFQPESFDSVISNQVFEHIFNPDVFLSEINRTLKPEGRLLLTVPFCWDEHEQPYDYARYSSFGLRAVLEKNGFQVMKHIKSVNDITAIFQLINAYIYKKVMTKNLKINLILTLILIFPLNLAGTLLSFLLPANDDFFLDNIVLARKIKDV